MKKNNFAAKIAREMRRQNQHQSIVSMQYAQDAACIAANEALGMGKGRARAFCEAFMAAVTEISLMTLEDSKDDKTFEYSKAKLDARLLEIVGEENFKPWEERYGV